MIIVDIIGWYLLGFILTFIMLFFINTWEDDLTVGDMRRMIGASCLSYIGFTFVIVLMCIWKYQKLREEYPDDTILIKRK